MSRSMLLTNENSDIQIFKNSIKKTNCKCIVVVVNSSLDKINKKQMHYLCKFTSDQEVETETRARSIYKKVWKFQEWTCTSKNSYLNIG